MATVWTVPLDITSRWLASAEVQKFLASNDLPDASADPLVRISQFGDVTRSLDRNVGRTFSSVQAASSALFDGIAGGVPVALKLASLRLILVEVYQMCPPPQPLPSRVIEELGQYVYLLLDPRSRSVFHVGIGTGNQLFGHVWEALAQHDRLKLVAESTAPLDEAARARTISTIREIYDSGLEVEHYIAARSVGPEISEQTLLSTVVAGIELTDPGTLTNPVEGVAAVPIESLVLRLSAEPAPDLPTPCLVLNVPAAGGRGVSDAQIYAAARGPWEAGTAVRGSANLPVVVLADDVVRATYRASSWIQAGAEIGQWKFEGQPESELDAQFVGKRITPDRVGLKKWPIHGWIPHLTHARPGR